MSFGIEAGQERAGPVYQGLEVADPTAVSRAQRVAREQGPGSSGE